MLGHPQFDYEAVPSVFGQRRGYGPLLLGLDTNLVIDLLDRLADEEAGFGFLGLFPDLWEDEAGALGDLVSVWFWRDVRFVISPLLLADSERRPLTAERIAERERVLAALGNDLWMRGGLERASQDEDGEVILVNEELPPSIHQEQMRLLLEGRESPLTLPRGFDGDLVREALESGCHGFLSHDKKVLRCNARCSRLGLVLLRPDELLARLYEGGEFSTTETIDAPFPDMISASTYYSMGQP